MISREHAYSLIAFLIISYVTMDGLKTIQGKLQDLIVLLFVLTVIVIALFYVEPRLKQAKKAAHKPEPISYVRGTRYRERSPYRENE